MWDYSCLGDACCKHFCLVKCPGIEFPNPSTPFCCWEWTFPSSLLFLLPPSHSLISLLFPYKNRKVGCNLSLHLKPVSLYPFQKKEDQEQTVCSLPSSLCKVSKNWTGAHLSPWQSWWGYLIPHFLLSCPQATQLTPSSSSSPQFSIKQKEKQSLGTGGKSRMGQGGLLVCEILVLDLATVGPTDFMGSLG